MMLSLAMMVVLFCSCEPEVDGPDSPTTPTTPDTPTMPDNTVVCGETVGEWVDLGLPSGLLWYSVNIGATSPEEYGCYFAWGETCAKETYSWSTYIYGDHSNSKKYTMYKYNTYSGWGTVDNKTILEASDDVATSVLGNGAHIPTYDDWVELLQNTTVHRTYTGNMVYGCEFVAENGNRLFLPAAGICGSSHHDAGTEGQYWSSSLDTVNTWYAKRFKFDKGQNEAQAYYVTGQHRFYGVSVRAVRTSLN